MRLLAGLVFAPCVLAQAVAAQSTSGRLDLRCQQPNNILIFRTPDTNTVVGYASWHRHPRAMLTAHRVAETNWTELRFQFLASRDDVVTLTLKARLHGPQPTDLVAEGRLWVDSVSLTAPGGSELVRNGSFEAMYGTAARLSRRGQPEKWGYRGRDAEIRTDADGAFPHHGLRCVKITADLPLFQSLRIRSNTWYTVRAQFRKETRP